MGQWLSSFSIRRRLQLVSGLFLLAILVPLVGMAVALREDARAAEMERSGLAPARAIIEATRHVQAHRGLSATVLNGAAQAEPRRRDAALQASRALAALADPGSSAELRHRTGYDLAERVGPLQARFTEIERDVATGKVAPAASFKRHTALVAELMDLGFQTARHSTLLLDPVAADYHLIIAALVEAPRVTEALGQLRGYGAGMLARGEWTLEEHRQMAVLLATLEDRLFVFRRALGTAMEESAATREAIEAEASLPRLTRFVTLVREELLTDQTPTLAPGAYFDAGTQAIDAQISLADHAADQLDGSLAARIAQAHGRLGVQLGLLVVLGLLAIGMVWSLMRAVLQPLTTAVRLSGKLAAGDLSQPFVARSQDELGALFRALETVRLAWTAALGEVRAAADQLSSASSQIASGNQDLSGRTEQAAARLQQTASTVEQLSGVLRETEQSARNANELAAQASDSATQGGEVVSRVVDSMEQIHAASRKIGDIIAVIDGLAFQTNILALNAAVEAARAGEQGRGFAVVAGEVRSLAQRSAAAAREIRSLIQESTERVEAGATLVRQAGDTMQQIVGGVSNVRGMITGITRHATQQAAGVTDLNQTMGHLDAMTQQNSALIEQSAAAAASLHEQATRLAGIVSRFRIETVERADELVI